MAETGRTAEMAEIVAAGQRYRDAMRRYQMVQATLIARGASLDDLVAGNWDGYAAAADAEERLFALLDAFDTAALRCS